MPRSAQARRSRLELRPPAAPGPITRIRLGNDPEVLLGAHLVARAGRAKLGQRMVQNRRGRNRRRERWKSGIGPGARRDNAASFRVEFAKAERPRLLQFQGTQRERRQGGVRHLRRWGALVALSAAAGSLLKTCALAGATTCGELGSVVLIPCLWRCIFSLEGLISSRDEPKTQAFQRTRSAAG